MIRLFRKIRQQLLTKDKYSVYFLYASGEILLVVVGILVALQIDNLNDKRKERIKELTYLNGNNNPGYFNLHHKNILLNMDLVYSRIYSLT